jgi:hypothetical protein
LEKVTPAVAAAKSVALGAARDPSLGSQQLVGAAAPAEPISAAVAVKHIGTVVSGEAVVAAPADCRLHVGQPVAFAACAVSLLIGEIDMDRRAARFVADDVDTGPAVEPVGPRTDVADRSV